MTDPDQVARAFRGSPAPKIALGVIAAIYLTAVFIEAAKEGSAATVLKLPRPLAYFGQLASLFPRASRRAIDYRVEGFRCKDQAWIELEPWSYFPIDQGHKENRFYRAIHFYGDAHPHRPTLRALDEFVVTHENARRTLGGDPIGGIRLLKVTTPFGKPGEKEERYRPKPIAEYPKDQRKTLYYSPISKREERCKWIAR
jgi:hypothetical protein